MAEKIKSSKNDKEIKEDLVDINIKSFKCSNANDRESKIIIKIFNENRIGTNILQNKTIPYFYHELLDNGINDSLIGTKNINDYFTSIK
jgi:hypothetical protein